mgnify:CR=1 FL=1
MTGFLGRLFRRAPEAGEPLGYADARALASHPDDAVRWQRLPDQLRAMVRSGAWDENRGLYLEGPARYSDSYSQHTQCAAIAAGVATPAQMQRIGEQLVSDPTLLSAHFMQRYYVARALEQIGLYGAFHRKLLQPWRVLGAPSADLDHVYSSPQERLQVTEVDELADDVGVPGVPR